MRRKDLRNKTVLKKWGLQMIFTILKYQLVTTGQGEALTKTGRTKMELCCRRWLITSRRNFKCKIVTPICSR